MSEVEEFCELVKEGDLVGFVALREGDHWVMAGSKGLGSEKWAGLQVAIEIYVAARKEMELAKEIAKN
jgi:hypothetical protein